MNIDGVMDGRLAIRDGYAPDVKEIKLASIPCFGGYWGKYSLENNTSNLAV